jgi:hypothetical protein
MATGDRSADVAAGRRREPARPHPVLGKVNSLSPGDDSNQQFLLAMAIGN